MSLLVMAAIFEHSTATPDSLSQSYCISIQKIAGIENATSNNFQVPEKILERRKRAWNDLFEKYSNMVSEVQLNLHTLQSTDLLNPLEVVEPRLPMRKPMSMVQYWVDTGNLLHIHYTNSLTYSNLESSINEQDYFEPIKHTKSQSFDTNASIEKHSNIAEVSGNKNLRIATSSNSSVDTAVYILANNNVTKKEETIAIVEGSKVCTKIQIPLKVTRKFVETNKNSKQFSLRENNFKKLNMEDRHFSQSFLSKSCIDKITQNIKNANFDKMCKNNLSLKLKQENNHICSIFFSDSDESHISTVQNSKFQSLKDNNIINNDLSKCFGRKKLYKRSDSPTEFTPVSEDNLSLHTSRLLLEKRLPFRKSKHPALETPIMSSRFLSRTRCGGTKFKRKLSQHFSSVCIEDNQKTKNQKLFGPIQNNHNTHEFLRKDCIFNNNPMLSQTSLIDDTNRKENDNHNNINILKQSFVAQASRVPKSLSGVGNSLSSCKSIWKNELKLKSCKVVVQKLPHKDYLLNLKYNMPRNQKLISTINSKIPSQEVDKSSCNHALTSNLVSKNNAACFIDSAITSTEKTTNIRANNLIIFVEEKEKQLLNEKNVVETSVELKKLQMNGFIPSMNPVEKTSGKYLKLKNKELCNEKRKYVIADSSSDESDLIIPLLNIKHQSLSAVRNSKNLSSNNFSDKAQKCIQLEKASVQSFISMPNGEHPKVLTHENNSKKCSCKQKKFILQFSKYNGSHADLEHEEIKKNKSSDSCQSKMCPTDCSKLKPNVKGEWSASSQDEASMPPKKRIKGVDLIIKNQLIDKSTNSVIIECKNSSNSMASENFSVNKFHQVNNKVNINENVSKMLTKDDETTNKKDICLSHMNSGNNRLDILSIPTNYTNDEKALCKISVHSHMNKNSFKLEKKKLMSKKQEKVRRLLKLKTAVTQKNTTIKRNSFETNLSSDEECIIPLKKKSSKF